MIRKLTATNFGPLSDVQWTNLGSINLVIGDNGTGKTFLLKAMYAALRTLEEYRRGDENRSDAEILAEKLHWTFQAEKIGDLVAKGAQGPLHFSLSLENESFEFSFGKDTTRQISTIENRVAPRKMNSIFLPAKEILSLHHIILKSRERDKSFGFDDTCLDLSRALRIMPRAKKNHSKFLPARKRLEKMIDGKVEFDEASGRWQFRKGKQKFPIGTTAEGVKKIAVLDTLLANAYLDSGSIVFMDEPEAALHPIAISELLDMLTQMALENGIQFFLASHSYFVVKKLYLISQENKISVPVLSMTAGTGRCADLKDGLPDNAIIDESIRLYEKEVEVSLR